MNINDKLREKALELGTDFFGIADLSEASDVIFEQGDIRTSTFPKAVSIGIRLLDTIVDQLPQRNKPAVAVSYRHHCYDVINRRLDWAISQIGSFIQNNGFKAFPIPASKRAKDSRICSIFSHKMAAHLAGLGWIGKSCLLITPEAGPRVRLSTVLTDAPLQPMGKSMKQRCGNCSECVDICPQKAFTGKFFDKSEPREARYNAAKCENYWHELLQKKNFSVCGMCVYICPFGRKK